jgi:hypothetical protein
LNLFDVRAQRSGHFDKWSQPGGDGVCNPILQIEAHHSAGGALPKSQQPFFEVVGNGERLIEFQSGIELLSPIVWYAIPSHQEQVLSSFEELASHYVGFALKPSADVIDAIIQKRALVVTILWVFHYQDRPFCQVVPNFCRAQQLAVQNGKKLQMSSSDRTSFLRSPALNTCE